jgi:large subunit ribosomal protein L24e
MVVRTRNCEFCEYKIYPGRGIVYVARDGSSKLYINKKSMNLDKAKTKSHMIRWTTAWRRKNKKLKATGIIKKRRKKKARILKSITGLTVEDIRKRRQTNASSTNTDARKLKIKQ